jgi:hypothetical protein
MESVKFADILHLLAASDEPVEHLKQLFAWQIERAMTAVRTTATAAGAIVVALIAALLSGEAVADWVLALAGGIALLILAFGYSRYERARALEDEYVVALGVLRETAPLAPLLRLSPDLYLNG